MTRYVNRSRYQSTPTPTSVALALLDVAAVADAGLLAWWIQSTGWADGPSLNVQIVIALASVVTVLVFAVTGLYRAWRGQTLGAELRGLLVPSILTAGILAIILVPSRREIPELFQWVGIWAGLTTVFLVSARVVLRIILRKLREAGWNVKKIVLVGGGAVADRAIRQIEQNRWAGLKVVGVFAGADERWPAEKERRIIERPPTLGGYDSVAQYLDQHKDIDQVWFSMPLSAEGTIREVLDDLRFSTIDICFVPDIFGFDLLNHSISEVAGLPLLNLRVSPIIGPNRILKLLEDWVVSLVALSLAAPLLLVIAVLIKAGSKGPVFYKQKRHGWDGKPFTIYKFRTMRMQKEADGKVVQARRDDDRITPVGYWLRRTSLDEFPQFINVLQGRMSVVGPRPHAVEHGESYVERVDKYMLRHKVKPGITGLAQINGFRGETETLDKMQDRIEYDLQYIENWTLFLDLKIIFLTFFRGFIHENAY